MKKKFNIISFALIAAVLFSILFQSIHSIEHTSSELLSKKCLHKHNSAKEITHQHHKPDSCYVCHFTLGNYTLSEKFTFKVYASKVQTPYFFNFYEKVISYSNHNFSLRGPPKLVV